MSSTLRFPREINGTTMREIAWVTAHEIGHLVGLRHKRTPFLLMSRHYSKDHVAKDPRFAFADDPKLRLSKKEVKQKTPVDLQAKRAEHARAKVKELTTKIKRLETARRKWQSQVKRYAKLGK